MRELTDRDYLRLLEGVRQVHDASDFSRLPMTMLRVVKELIPVEHVSYNELNLKADRAFSCFDTPDMERTMHSYLPAFERLMPEHPIVQEFEARPLLGSEVRIRKISDTHTQQAYHELGLYRDCYRHLDTEYQMVLPILAGGGSAVGIALNRKLRDFSERDREVLKLLRPHFRTAYENAFRRMRLRRVFDPAQHHAAAEDLRQMGLTQRQAMVVLHAVQGKNSSEIGKALYNSPRTVQKHMEHIFEKLGVASRAAMIVKVVEWLERKPPNDEA